LGEIFEAVTIFFATILNDWLDLGFVLFIEPFKVPFVAVGLALFVEGLRDMNELFLFPPATDPSV